MSEQVTLRFEQGTIAVEGEYSVPHTTWDDRTENNRALAYRYRDIRDHLAESNISFADEVLRLLSCPNLSLDVSLRPYQQEALEAWDTQRTGVLVLPTGAGKTYIAMKAVETVNAPAFIVVPTLDLVDQWKDELAKFDIEIGEYTGREKNLQPITVSTYDSAYIHADNLGNRFQLLVFDEVHHLPSEGYRHIAEFFAAPDRLGLTATYQRQDDLHEELPRLVGGIVYETGTDELAGEYLAEYETEKITVDLTAEEREQYDEYVDTFKSYLRKSNIQLRSPQDFRKIVMRSGNDPDAWEAVRARNAARQLAYSSDAKLDVLADLLERHADDRIIVFTRYNDLVYDIAQRFFIPAITHTTDKAERQDILQRFRDNEYSAIVSSQVLDEGVDVPDANIGIILSGTGSSREYKQRLGRILRPSGKPAKLYEIVSKDTGELRTSYRRNQ